MPSAIVTGISQGLGLAITDLFTRAGWHVVGDARTAEQLHTAVAALPHAERVTAIPGDVTDAGHRAALVNAAREYGALRLLVHNASALGPSPLPGLDVFPAAALEAVFKTNVVAPILLTQAALPLLRDSEDPTVVMVSSDAAVEAYPAWGGYGASKAALDQVAAVLAAEQPDLRVYAFDPGDMRTDMHQRAFPGEDISDRADPATVAPGLLRLLQRRPVSGRYRAAEVDTAEAA
jgi:NAD(P)-dependent dehydrogenase (short-subunit alcohol dehydrogenase family)